MVRRRQKWWQCLPGCRDATPNRAASCRVSCSATSSIACTRIDFFLLVTDIPGSSDTIIQFSESIIDFIESLYFFFENFDKLFFIEIYFESEGHESFSLRCNILLLRLGRHRVRH